MSGSNRGRFSVTLGGHWRLYTHPLPGWQMLGTVQRGMDIGALGESSAALLAQINAGAVRSLDQRKARAALDAARRETDMASAPTGITIPPGLDFAALQLQRDPATGDISFDWVPIERICEASGLDLALFRDGPEDNLGALLTAWYRDHLATGGVPDATMADLIGEVALEDLHGSGLSHPPGRA